MRPPNICRAESEPKNHRKGGNCAQIHSNTHTRTSLLERLRNGDDPATWNEFFARYWPFVFSVARQRGCTEHTAEEIVQEVMLAIFERRAVFRHDPAKGRFRDWLGGVARNKAAAWRRASAERPYANDLGQGGFSEPETSTDAPDARWEAAYEQALLSFLLDKVRREVNPRTYQAFEAFTLGGCSGAETARLTGLSRNAVYQARKNIIRRLRELGVAIGRRGPPDELIQAAIDSRPSIASERSIFTRNANRGCV